MTIVQNNYDTCQYNYDLKVTTPKVTIVVTYDGDSFL